MASLSFNENIKYTGKKPNFERDQFKDLIQEIVKGNIELIVIENKDRLCRFGFDLFNEYVPSPL